MILSAARKGAARGAALAVALAVALACWLPGVARADEAAADAVDPANRVNPQQLPDSSFIYDTSISDLAGANTYYDNQTVQVTGEAVGDNISANLDGTERWVTLSAQGDANSTVSTLMSAEEALRVDTFGRYGSTGTILQVRGTFHVACAEHEGLTDLHAEHVSVVEAGVQHPDEFDPAAFVPGAVLVGLGLVLVLVFYRLRERQR